MSTILIVEDESILAMKTKLDLESMGHEVIGISDNGPEAIKIALDKKPDVILMDILLKGEMNGIQTARKLLEAHDFSVIYLTAHTDGITIDAVKTTKHTAMIGKPFSYNELKRTLNLVLGKTR